MTSLEIARDIFWVGVVDWNIRDFHGYFTRRGTTYNAYLLRDERNVLVDTVKHTFADELEKNISEIVDLDELDYIILNHLEMDHSSALPRIVEKAKNAKVIVSPRGKNAFIRHYGEGIDVETVKTGDKLKTGRRTLMFIEAPMLHWPDSMFTYVAEDAILMPNDAFGQHLASSKRFDDEVDGAILIEEAAKYYANILMPLWKPIARKIEEVVAMEIPIKMIAPSHGVIWRSDPMKIVSAYRRWSEGESKEKVVIVYDSMWGSTTLMARAIAEGVSSQGLEVKFFKIRESDMTEIVTEILEAKAVVVGSPTINTSMFPSVGSFLTYVGGLKPVGKIWAFFGSYGWGGGAVKQMVEVAKKAGFDVYERSMEVQYVPTRRELEECFGFGREIAQKAK
ncbi:FprA family A-type flavoprotein [Candidatus Bathyarchaeota archaeon]|nr:FprA family A-type flavoprotein [Candidatus Bathyarchaeota archaeon]